MMQDAPWQPRHADSGPLLRFPSGPMAVDPLSEVARRARDGDVWAQRRLLEAIAPSLLPPLRMILGPAHPDIEDVLQEALVGVLRGLASFRGESTVLHFARRVATKRAIEACRRQRTAARKLEHAQQLEVPTPPTPRETMVANRQRQHLRDLLAELPGAQADALAMRAVLGYSLDEIADATGVPVNTVRSRLRLAKEALRKRIDTDPSLGELLEEMS